MKPADCVNEFFSNEAIVVFKYLIENARIHPASKNSEELMASELCAELGLEQARTYIEKEMNE